MAGVDVAIPRNVTVERALRGRRVDAPGLVFQGLLLLALLVCLGIILTLVGTVLDDGLTVFQERGFVISRWPDEIGSVTTDVWDFLVQPIGVVGAAFSALVFGGVPLGLGLTARRHPKLALGLVAAVAGVVVLVGFLQTSDFLTTNLSLFPERAGVAQAIFGSVMLAVIVAVVAFPLGVATALYLEEYAPDNRLTRLVRLNIRNLAGVPSVVYGLLGLAVFVQLLGTEIADFPLIGGVLEDVFGANGITGGRTIIAGGLTLALVVLPIVIITASEAIRAVPQSLREGGYGIGATKWEVQKNLVLPNSFAGVLTGTVLSLSRAIGETAPLILVGAFFGTFFTTGDANLWDKFSTSYTALPQVVFQWSTEPAEEFKLSLAAAAIIVLLAVTLLANLSAVLLRNRFEKRW